MPAAVIPITADRVETSAILPETRGYYLAPSERFSLESIRAEMERAADAGFNLILFPVYVNGYTLFPCEAAGVLGRRFPRINPLFKRWDPLKGALEAAREFGLSLWGLVRPYNFDPRYSVAPHKLLKKHPGFALVAHPDFEDSPLRRRESWVACPVNPDYRRYLGDMLSELIFGYPVDGIVLNFTGYGLRTGPLAGSPFCFCASCRAAFAADHAGNLEINAADPERLAAVRRWQTEISTETLEYLRHRMIKSRRTLRLVCRAHPQWRWNSEGAGPSVHARYALDWNRLLGSGVVEELIIDHDEEIDPDLFSCRLVSDLAELHHESLLLPAIRVSSPADLEAPLRAVRKYPIPGFVAEFANPPSAEEAELIRERFLSEPAQLPERSPLLAVAYLLRRVQNAHADSPLIADFMRDFLRLVERAYRHEDSFRLLGIIFDNLAGLRDAIRRGRLGDYPIPEQTLRDIGLARRMVRLASLDVRT